MEEEKVYYVYIYLNILKPGEYIFEQYSFDYEPFYVGFGKNHRYRQHLYKHSLLSKSHKNNTIKKILKENKEPFIIKVKENITSLEAKELEIKLISLIGRNDLNKGSLTNRTDGGDSTGYIHSEESLIKMRKHQSENHPFKNKKRPEHSLYMTENNPMFDIKTKQKHLESCRTEEFRENAKRNNIGNKNPFYGKIHTEETKLYLKELNQIKIDQIDIETLEIIKTFDSIKDIPYQNISGCCRGKYLSSKSYYWEYHDEDLKQKYYNNVLYKREHSRKIRKIFQYDLNNNFLNVFNNATIASNETGTNQNNILKCCKNKQEKSNGFKWSYL